MSARCRKDEAVSTAEAYKAMHVSRHVKVKAKGAADPSGRVFRAGPFPVPSQDLKFIPRELEATGAYKILF